MLLLSRRAAGGLALAMALSAGCVESLATKYDPEPGSVELEKKKAPEKKKLDPELPNVLIIGDSISMGYTPEVQRLLKGKANVVHAPGNNQGTTLGRKKLSEWLGDTQWDVIHFNWGLHDLKHVKVAGTSQNSNNPADPQQADIEQYEENLNILVKQLKATGARLIFATTTPFPEGVKPCRKPEYAAQYNAVALNIMEANEINVNDLHGLILPRLKELQKPINVHFNPQGSKLMADQVAAAILKQL